jgi:manganese/zinc/iron transport system ATP- binding protein
MSPGPRHERDRLDAAPGAADAETGRAREASGLASGLPGARAPALELRRLTVSYDSRPVLWDVDAAFPVGALSAIVGPNGAGKSTLLRAALGLVPADAGQSLIEGRPARAALDRVAYVPQRESIDWDFPITVREVVEMGRYASVGWFRRVPRSERAFVDECLERVGMVPFVDRQIGSLSGGQRQRVFIARALAQRAPLMLLDEPFAGIDPIAVSDIQQLVRHLTARGIGVLITDHNVRETLGLIDRAYILHAGQVLTHGPAAEIVENPDVRRLYLGEAFTL